MPLPNWLKTLLEPAQAPTIQDVPTKKAIYHYPLTARYTGLTTDFIDIKPPRSENWLLDFLLFDFETGVNVGLRYLDVFLIFLSAGTNRFLKEFITPVSSHLYYAFGMGNNFDGWLFPDTKLLLTADMYLHFEFNIIGGDNMTMTGSYGVIQMG